MPLTAAVPQGSVIGSFLRNIMYDEVLKVKLPHDCELVGYADHIALLCTGVDFQDIELMVNSALRDINGWIVDNGLRLAPAKYEAMIFTTRRVFALPNFRLDGQVIEIESAVKYLGLRLDKKLSFDRHVPVVVEKAQNFI